MKGLRPGCISCRNEVVLVFFAFPAASAFMTRRVCCMR